jgi:hypothetical protein
VLVWVCACWSDAAGVGEGGGVCGAGGRGGGLGGAAVSGVHVGAGRGACKAFYRWCWR